MAIELTSAPSNTINSIRASLSAADSSAYRTVDNNSLTESRVVCNYDVVKMASPASGTLFYSSGDGDFTTAEWSNQGGAGTVVFNDSDINFNLFVDNTLGQFDEASTRVEFNNDGVLLTLDNWGFNGPNVSLTTIEYPESPVAIDSVTFHLVFINRIALDSNTGDYGMYVYDNTLDISSTRDVTIDAGDDLRLYANDILALRNRGNDEITFTTNHGNNNEREWEFNRDGTTKIPSHLMLRNINNYYTSGSIQTHPLSSGDGNGYTTMELHPDMSRSNSGQYLIIDPTAPNHIHIRAGGEQDNASAQLILGGENSYVSVGQGPNPSVYVAANSNFWEFGNNGYIYFPDGGILRIKGTAPGTSIGTEGDNVGMIAFDNDYFYYCTSQWNGSDNIWKRVQFSASTW